MDRAKPVNALIGILLEQILVLVLIYFMGQMLGDIVLLRLLSEPSQVNYWRSSFDLLGMAVTFLLVCETRIQYARIEVTGGRERIEWNYLRFIIQFSGFCIVYLFPALLLGLPNFKELPFLAWVPLGLFWTIYYLRIERNVRNGKA